MVEISGEPFLSVIKVFTDAEELINIAKSKYPQYELGSISRIKGLSVFFEEEKSRDIYLLLPKRFEPAIVAHECIHVSWHLFSKAGVKISPKNHEAQCYYVQYLIEQIQKNVYGKKRKANKTDGKIAPTGEEQSKELS